MAIDPANCEAHSLLAVLAGASVFDWNLSEKHHGLALAEDPVPPASRVRYAVFHLLALRRHTEAIEQCRLALETDPLSMFVHMGMVLSLLGARQYQRAIEHAHRSLEIDANFYLLWTLMGQAQLELGFTNEAIASLNRAAELAPWQVVSYAGGLAAAYHLAGDPERSREWAQKLAGKGGVGLAHYYAVVGDADAMFSALESAAPTVWSLLWSAVFDPYRTDPRLQALLRRRNLPGGEIGGLP